MLNPEEIVAIAEVLPEVGVAAAAGTRFAEEALGLNKLVPEGEVLLKAIVEDGSPFDQFRQPGNYNFVEPRPWSNPKQPG